MSNTMSQSKIIVMFSILASNLLVAMPIASTFVSAQQQLPAMPSAEDNGDSLNFVYTKSGGIAGVNEKIVFNSTAHSNIITFYNGFSNVTEKRVSESDALALRDLISTSGFFEMDKVYPPKKTGVADYFSYTLAVDIGGKANSVSWVDEFASEKQLPASLGKIADTIRQVYANSQKTDDGGAGSDGTSNLGKRRIAETVLAESYPHDAEGHSMHQAFYFVHPYKNAIYRGEVTFTLGKPADILVYHDVTNLIKADQDLSGITIHHVDGRKYAVTTLLRNVTSGTVDFVGSAILAHSASGEPFAVAASTDALKKTSSILTPLVEGKSFTLDVAGERFNVYATDKETIQQLTDNYNGENNLHVMGKIVQGNGGFNQPWSWHLDPDSVRMAEISIEVCDGRPSLVEQDLGYWINTVGNYCPWSSEVVAINN